VEDVAQASEAEQRYRALVGALLAARAAAPSGELSQDEEAERAEELNEWWERLDDRERTSIEKDIATGAFGPI